MFTEDLSAFFSTEGFAQEAKLKGRRVLGIFDNQFEVVGVGLAGVAGTTPAFTLATSDVPAQVVGASLVVNAGTYRVAENQPDGTGVTVLLLERV